MNSRVNGQMVWNFLVDVHAAVAKPFFKQPNLLGVTCVVRLCNVLDSSQQMRTKIRSALRAYSVWYSHDALIGTGFQPMKFVAC